MKTPYYKFNLNQVCLNYLDLSEAIDVDKLYYALKPNSEMEILEALNNIQANFEVVSSGEYLKLKKIGVLPERIICSLPIKTTSLIKFLYDEGIRYFVFDNMEEFAKLSQYAPSALKIMRIYINDFVTETIEFGVQMEEFLGWLETNRENIKNIGGITFYICDNYRIEILEKVLDRCEDILNLLGKGKLLNIGGNYRLSSELPENFYLRLNRRISYLKNKYNCTIIAEPGRSIVKSAGKLITSVVHVKEKPNCTYVYTDAGIPTGISYAPKIIINNTTEKATPKLFKFFDITCSHRMLFEIELNYRICTGDILSFENFGSYSIAKSSNFHGWEKPQCQYLY